MYAGLKILPAEFFDMSPNDTKWMQQKVAGVKKVCADPLFRTDEYSKTDMRLDKTGDFGSFGIACGR